MEAFDEEGAEILQPITPIGYQQRSNKNGTHAAYLQVQISCHRGDLTELIRIDKPARGDVQEANRANQARLYPVGTKQFDFLYGRRNTSESFHNKMKRTMPRLPDLRKSPHQC